MLAQVKATVVVVLILTMYGSAVSAQAQAEFFRINVYLDKVTYTPSDESVKITGCLISEGTSVLGKQVSVVLHGPDGQVVASEFAPVNNSCNFEVNVDTRSLSEHGSYTVVATHETASDRKAFLFSEQSNLKHEGECAESYCTYYFELRGGIYEVQYSLTSGRLESIIVDTPAKSIMFAISSTDSNGTMTAVLPREVIDSAQNGTDIRFKVFVGSFTNGIQQVFQDEPEATVNDRIVVVNYPASDEQILVSINGTYLVPEFSGALILAAGLTGSAMVASRLGRNSKYGKI